MDNYEKSYLDIDDLAKKIEARIKELEMQEKQDKFKKEIEKKEQYTSKSTEKNISELDRIIHEIDKRIQELENEKKVKYELNIEDLTEKINKKLEYLDDIVEEDVGKTLDDLSEISMAINETIKKLEEKRKKKKEAKARYCNLARKNNKNCYKK